MAERIRNCPDCGTKLQEQEEAWICPECPFFELKKGVVAYLVEDKNYEDRPYCERKIDDGKCVAYVFMNWWESDEEMWQRIAQQTGMEIIGYSILGVILQKGARIYLGYITEYSREITKPVYVRIVRLL